MAMRINKFFNNVALIVILINILSCGENMHKIISEKELREKWDKSVNNSSESWWYAGSDESCHFIAVKRPYTSTIYKIKNSLVKIKGIDKFEFSDSDINWVNIKTNNLEFYNATQ